LLALKKGTKRGKFGILALNRIHTADKMDPSMKMKGTVGYVSGPVGPATPDKVFNALRLRRKESMVIETISKKGKGVQ